MKQYVHLLMLVTFIAPACNTTKKVPAAPATPATASTTAVNDGSSFEKAIAVKSITAEYAYVRQVCPDCKMKRQVLSFHDKKPYDILYFDNAGKEVVYYFDISSFFGKGF